jgi:hypothetical protein
MLHIKTISVQNLDYRVVDKLNIAMKQFRATIRASGMVVITIVFAENVNFATKILQAQFGPNNVIGIPTQIGNC